MTLRHSDNASTSAISVQARALWAKTEPVHPLWCHLVDVATVAQALLPRFGSIPELPDAFVALVAGLHDIGKADPWFQNKAPELVSSLREVGIPMPDHDTALLDGQRRFRHEARSAEWVQNLLVAAGWGVFAAPTIATAIHGHHGSFTTEFIYEEDASTRRMWDDWRGELAGILQRVLQPESCRIDRFANASDVGAKLSGLIVLADWIASNPELYRYDSFPTSTTPEVYYQMASAEARIALERLQFDVMLPVSSTRQLPQFHEVWPELKERSLRPIQQLLQDLCQENRLSPGLAIIEAPMGEGKTEAAIYLAECWNQQTCRRGCYLALPTQATANQMHQRYQRFLNARHPASSAARLVHGMAWLVDDVTPQAIPQTFGGESLSLATEWFRPARRSLLATDGVGTVDQALMAALNVKFGFLRLLGLGAKTLVIDEVHAYDEYMLTIMKRLLEWCRSLRVPVVLLSATLSMRQKRELCDSYAGKERLVEVADLLDRHTPESTPYPLLTSVPLTGCSVTIAADADASRCCEVVVHTHHSLLEDYCATAALAVQTIANGGCACVLSNTVKAAQAIFEELQNLHQSGALPQTRLFLFHARFPAWRRAEIEQEVTASFGKEAGSMRPQRAILVATQVVEQSLDVDFDVMISQIAPVDLLLQRCGRVWRHQRPPAERHGISGPVLHILTPPVTELNFGATERVYDREMLLRTLSLLSGRDSFRLPSDFRNLVEGCYGRGIIDSPLFAAAELDNAASIRDQQQAEFRGKARRHLLPPPSIREFNPSGNPAEEGEGETQSYFVAQTRLGDDSISVLLIEDEELLQVARSSLTPKSKPPGREVLKRLFLCKVGLPRWWLFTREQPCGAAEGFDNVFAGDGWLRHQLILPTRVMVPHKKSVWQGRDIQGREFEICNNNMLGVSRLALTSEERALDGESKDEADAGQLG